jgi:hypothetical protein
MKYAVDMTLRTKQQLDFIDIVANFLADNFLKQVLAVNRKSSYDALVDGLSEILDWSWEFYDQYYDMIIDWQMFRCSGDNIYSAATVDELVVAFGRSKVARLHQQIPGAMPVLAKAASF